ncbi:alpha-ketoglutarate-dependent dioxygenase AlkB family protein [Cognatishimia maritima]|uniref:Alkylated DNA repair protein (DNA oxidative demethylase) n=1 Tax=Cognatishimia maritima TaxID=870908 RepID=A0A1M5P6U5_9RHOB|nr:alpha-ketoglutarate-dependent dioxygenase AlkB [Cognatishimia maritima]SHG97478.1 alkylated DNA repair protein (DNA oxidative demethylase) [Cognatishimia maritima]
MAQIDPINLRGFLIYKGFLDRSVQEALVSEARAIAGAAPFFAPVTSRGQKMSVRMTSAGQLGWISDRSGYRYEANHPNGVAWPAIPEVVLDVWRAVADTSRLPDSCLINFYGEGARMGLHQDKDEGDFRWPVVSISLGDDALFRMGSPTRGGKTESIWLSSGDVVVMGGDARLSYHGIDRIRFKSASLLPNGGRINLTLRAVDQGTMLQQPSKP